MITIDELQSRAAGRELPGGYIEITPHESHIVDYAMLSPDAATPKSTRIAHPVWFVIASLRGMGISVDELCELAGKLGGDTLLFGGVIVEHMSGLHVGRTYETTARVSEVARRITRNGSTLDSVVVVVHLDGCGNEGADPPAERSKRAGTVTSTYLFLRAAA